MARSKKRTPEEYDPCQMHLLAGDGSSEDDPNREGLPLRVKECISLVQSAWKFEKEQKKDDQSKIQAAIRANTLSCNQARDEEPGEMSQLSQQDNTADEVSLYT